MGGGPAVRPPHHGSSDASRNHATTGSTSDERRFPDAMKGRGGTDNLQFNSTPDSVGVKLGNTSWDHNGTSDRVTDDFEGGINYPPSRSRPIGDAAENGGKNGMNHAPVKERIPANVEMGLEGDNEGGCYGSSSQVSAGLRDFGPVC